MTGRSLTTSSSPAHADFFKHVPLRSGSQEIRLLRLLSSRVSPEGSGISCPEQTIRCEVFHTTLGTEALPKYHALSYTWGDITDGTRLIEIDGKPFEVRANLFLALKVFRSEIVDREYSKCNRVSKKPATSSQASVPLTLWVDAICIDQNNVLERNSQVTMMRDVYTRAEQIVVWLGQDTEASRRGLQFIREMTTINHPEYWSQEDDDNTDSAAECVDMYNWPNGEEESNDVHRWLLTGIDEFMEYAQKLETVAELLRRPYWSRMWIVQEFMAGTRVRVWCGKDHIDAARIFDAQASFVQVLDKRGPFRTHVSKVHLHMGNREYYSRVILPLHTSGLWPIVVLKVRLDEKELFCHMDHVIGTQNGRKASNPRDMVYGLAGILNHYYPDLQLRVDYSLSTVEVYASFMRRCIEITGNLSLWRWLLGRSPALETLPTWVIDFGISSNQHVYFTGSDDRLAWAEGHPMEVSWNGHLMSLKGLHVGTVDAISEKFVQTRSDEAKLFAREYQAWVELVDQDLADEQDSYLRLSSSMLDPFGDVRTDPLEQLCDIVFQMLKHVPAEKLPTRLMARMPPTRPDYGITNLGVNHSMWDRRVIFSSMSASIGIAPTASRLGDIIFMPFGFEFATVLRPVANGRYCVIGHCYLDRMSHDAALDLLKRDKLKVEELVLQ